jgi:hypothetical protein
MSKPDKAKLRERCDWCNYPLPAHSDICQIYHDRRAVREALEPDLVLAVARAMKPRLFDPGISPEDAAHPSTVIARNHILEQAKAAIAVVLSWKAQP